MSISPSPENHGNAALSDGLNGEQHGLILESLFPDGEADPVDFHTAEHACAELDLPPDSYQLLIQAGYVAVAARRPRKNKGKTPPTLTPDLPAIREAAQSGLLPADLNPRLLPLELDQKQIAQDGKEVRIYNMAGTQAARQRAKVWGEKGEILPGENDDVLAAALSDISPAHLDVPSNTVAGQLLVTLGARDPASYRTDLLREYAPFSIDDVPEASPRKIIVHQTRDLRRAMQLIHNITGEPFTQLAKPPSAPVAEDPQAWIDYLAGERAVVQTVIEKLLDPGEEQ